MSDYYVPVISDHIDFGALNIAGSFFLASGVIMVPPTLVTDVAIVEYDDQAVVMNSDGDVDLLDDWAMNLADEDEAVEFDGPWQFAGWTTLGNSGYPPYYAEFKNTETGDITKPCRGYLAMVEHNRYSDFPVPKDVVAHALNNYPGAPSDPGYDFIPGLSFG